MYGNIRNKNDNSTALFSISSEILMRLRQISQYNVFLLTGRLGFDPRQGQRNFPLASASRPALGPTQPRVRSVQGVKLGRGVRLTLTPSSAEIKNY
jgi:hypothetical protein